MEKTHRISADISLKEICNFFTRFRYEVVNVFGFPLKVPKKSANSFKIEIQSLETLVILLGYEVKVKGNHSILEVTIKNKDSYYYLDFHVYHRSLIVNDMLPLRKKSKLKRVVVSRLNMNRQTIMYRSNDKFHNVLKGMQDLI